MSAASGLGSPPRKAKMIVIHCAATDEDVGVKIIDEWHKKRGMKRCGYHYVIRRDGSIEVGRSEEEIGAHAYGYNRESIGICVSSKVMVTDAQVGSLKELLLHLLWKHMLTPDDVCCHYQLTEHKTCPNINIMFIRALLKGEKPDERDLQLVPIELG